MSIVRRLLAAIGVAALGACAETATESKTLPEDLALYVSGGTQGGFYFLRPTVPSAPERFPGVFDPNRRLVVKVICTTATHERCPLLATFDRDGLGTGPLTVEGEQYQANWTGTSVLTVGQGKYRLLVYDGAAVLGQADLWVVRRSSELTKVTPDYVGVVKGAPFSIRFRVETTAGIPAVVDTVVVVPDSTVVSIGQAQQLVAVPMDAAGNPILGRVAAWASSDVTVAPISATGVVSAIGVGRAVITATIDGKTGQGVVLVADQLPGLPTGSAAAAIPNRLPVVVKTEYDRNHPAVPGFLMSFTTAVVSPTVGATVADLNAVLAEFRAAIVGGMTGVDGKSGGILFLRFPTTTHLELDAIIVQLRGRPAIASAVADHEIGPTMLTKNAVLLDWIWTVLPGGGNWGMEVIRAPALWNLNDFVRKSGRRTATGVIDVGFTTVHQDLVIAQNQTPTVIDDHGTHVAGTIGATFDNGLGIDGVNPFADLNLYGLQGATYAEGLSEFCVFLTVPPAPAVVNASLGYNWSLMNINTTTNPMARSIAEADGRTVTDCLTTVGSSRALPVIISAAGNDGAKEAKWASPWNAAALIHNAAPIIVVEAADVALTPQIAGFSNVHGHVSAPGVDILSTMTSVAYGLLQGTSMAAPHVAGLVSYLAAFAPALGVATMSTNPIRDLLAATGSVGTGVIAPRIDAFAAALDVDRLTGTDQVVRALADFDDGTSDGNRRVDPQGNIDLNEDTDGDGGRGDGNVDMADFRRWRDWLLDVEQPVGLTLDGGQNLAKRDQNGDHEYWSVSVDEGDFSRGDLNGDGAIHRSRAAALGGVFRGRQVSDLDVMAEVFSDPVYDKGELPGLLTSGDVTVDAGSCFDFPNAASVDIAIQINADTTLVVRQHRYGPADRTVTLTVPPDPAGYGIRVAALDAAGTPVITSVTKDSVVTLGGDIQYRATCGRVINGNVIVLSDQGLATMADVVKIIGNFEIRGGVTSVDLRELPILEEITGRLRLLKLPNLTGIGGLTKLERLRSFTADSMPNFASLTRLDSLTQAPDTIKLNALPSLAGLRPLAGLTIGDLRLSETGLDSLDAGAGIRVGAISVSKEPDLRSLKGLLPMVGGPPRIELRESPQLKSLAGLAGLAQLGGLTLFKVPVEILTELTALTVVNSNFVVQQITGLDSWAAFSGLAQIAGGLTIDPGIATVVTFPSLLSVGTAVGQGITVRQDTPCSLAQAVSFPVLAQSRGLNITAARCPMTVSAAAITGMAFMSLGGAQLVAATLPSQMSGGALISGTGIVDLRLPGNTGTTQPLSIFDNQLLERLTMLGPLDIDRLLIQGNLVLNTVTGMSGRVRTIFSVVDNVELSTAAISAWPLNLSTATVTVTGNKVP